MSESTDFSTQSVTPQLVSQIVDAIRGKKYGSVEIYIQNSKVVQITERTINKIVHTTDMKPKKTSYRLVLSKGASQD